MADNFPPSGTSHSHFGARVCDPQQHRLQQSRWKNEDSPPLRACCGSQSRAPGQNENCCWTGARIHSSEIFVGWSTSAFRLIAFLVILSLGLSTQSRAAMLSITGDTADYELGEGLTAGVATATTMRVGATSATTPGGRNVIYIFALPGIGATNQVSAATLNFNYATKSGSPTFNADLWSIGFFPSIAAVTNYYLEANADMNPATFKLQDNIITSATTAATTLTTADFANYLQTFYATNASYTGGSYVFLRLNPDVDAGNVIAGYNLSSANSTSKPTLTITTALITPPPPTNVSATARNAQVIVRWNSVAGATSYQLKRGPTSGAYTVTNSLTATNFTDTGLSNGVPYYYVVSAVGTNGASANSSEMFAVPGLFVHPGILHTFADLERMKTNVAAGNAPWSTGYAAFAAHSGSQSNYAMQGPFGEYGRNPDVNTTQMHNDCNAAYQNAVMWYLTGRQPYANKAIQILNSWSATLTNISGKDASLAASFDGFKFVNAAEILRYTRSGWAQSNIVQCEQWFKTVWYPELEPFALYANGNWDLAAIKAIMSIGVFCNDRPMYERAVRFYVNGPGNGRLTYYVLPNGENQESGRDQQHSTLALGTMAEAAQVGWSQGLDLYGHAANRLLAAYEHAASFNLSNSVSYTPFLDRTGQYGLGGTVQSYTTMSELYRGQYRPVFEIAWNHYVNRMGLTATYTKQFADANRPEGAAASSDHPGFGTLLFSLPVAAPPAASAPPTFPAGLFARGTNASVVLGWASSLNATSYNVQRATNSGGPYTTIATGITNLTYADTTAEAGRLYFYTLTASNAFGESEASVELAAAPNRPAPWQNQDVGSPSVPGYVDYDGTFKLEAAGSDIGGTSDQFHFVYVSLTGDATITARVIWPLSSQSAKVGVMMRDGLGGTARHASMLLVPKWVGSWAIRTSVGSSTTLSNTATLPEPYVFNNRLMQPYWVRVSRAGNVFTGSISPDGTNWTVVGSNTITMSSTLYVGLVVCSRLAGVTTSAAFDSVSIPGWPAAPSGLSAMASNAQVSLTWNASPGALGYNVKRSTTNGGPYQVVSSNLTSLSYTDAGLTNGTLYYFVVSANSDTSESVDSAPASARPVSFSTPQLSSSLAGDQFQLAWPMDHTGWRLEAQTNSTALGLSTDWTTVSGSTNSNLMLVPVDAGSGCVFFRLVYP